jgi:hypothetical protein
MTTLTHPKDAGVRPDVRTETHTHRHRRPPARWLWMRSPWWLVAIVGSAVSALFTLATVSYAVPQIV